LSDLFGLYSEFIVLLTNKKRRALHDFMAGTVVIRGSGKRSIGREQASESLSEKTR
jgi:uncharacterized RDD family membrane protein YckC